MFHGIIHKHLSLKAYTVTFVIQASFHILDTREDKWLNAQINIQSMAPSSCEIILVTLRVVH